MYLLQFIIYIIHIIRYVGSFIYSYEIRVIFSIPVNIECWRNLKPVAEKIT